MELQRKEQEMMQMNAKMKTVEEQHADYQKHIAVLKESLIAKEEHYNMLQLDVRLLALVVFQVVLLSTFLFSFFRLTSFEPNWKRKTKPSKRKLERPSMRHRRRTAFPTNSVICEIKLTSKTGKLTCCKER